MMPKKVILHVEDDAGLARAVSSVLRAADFNVITAYNGEEGLRKAIKLKPDLIILDLSMPGMSGLTFLRQFGASAGERRPPVLVFTAFAGMADSEILQQASGILLKPAHPDKIVAEVRRLLAEWEDKPAAGA